jgi:hypothetical protein
LPRRGGFSGPSGNSVTTSPASTAALMCAEVGVCDRGGERGADDGCVVDDLAHEGKQREVHAQRCTLADDFEDVAERL